MNRLMFSARAPIDQNGNFLPVDHLSSETFSASANTNVGDTVTLHRAMANLQIRKLEERGLKVKPYTNEEIERRAYAKGEDKPEDGSTLYETAAELCERRMVDPADLAKIQTRGLDGGTDTALVGTDYLHEFARDLRLSGRLQGLFSRHIDIPQGYSSLVVPIIGDAQFLKQGALTTDTYAVNTAVDPTSTTVTLTPVKMQTVIFVSGELTEESLAPIIEALTLSIQRGFGVALDHVLISGDTVTTTANINAYGSDGGIAALGSYDPRLMFDGFRAMDWKSTTGKSAATFSGIDCGSNIATIDDVVGTLGVMGKYADDPAKVLTIMPIQVEKDILLDSKARPDTYSAIINAQTGRLVTVGGSKVVAVGNSTIVDDSSSNVPTYATWMTDGYPVNLNASGVYDAATATQTGFVCVREDVIAFGWKRQLEIKVIDLPLSDQKAITATVRVVAKQIHAGRGVVCSYNAD